MIEKLLEYQKIDGGLKAIENELRQSDEFKKYAQAVKFLKTVTDSKNQIESKALALMSTLSSLEEKLNKLNDDKSEFNDLDGTTDGATIAFLKKKSSELSKKFAALEAELQQLSQDMTDLAAQYKSLAAKTKVMRAQQDEYKEKYEEISKGKDAQKAEIKKQLSLIEKDIPSEYLAKYKEKRKDPKFPIVYEVNGKHCAACGTELSQLEFSRLKNEKIIECENCRRLIFIKD